MLRHEVKAIDSILPLEFNIAAVVAYEDKLYLRFFFSHESDYRMKITNLIALINYQHALRLIFESDFDRLNEVRLLFILGKTIDQFVADSHLGYCMKYGCSLPCPHDSTHVCVNQ